VLHISIWGIEAFSGVLSGGGSGILGPCDSVAPPIGGYGVRLIRLWLRAWLEFGFCQWDVSRLRKNNCNYSTRVEMMLWNDQWVIGNLPV